MLFFIFLLFAFMAKTTGVSLEPVNALDVSKYVGNWYQVYGAPTNYVFQGYGICATAQYGLLYNGNVTVLNSQVNKAGQLEQIEGYAYYQNASEPGKLSVVLDGVPVVAPYWVMKLGEVVDGEYEYSVVSTPSFISLWVLARDVDEFFAKYDEEVREYLDMNGFKYVAIEQGDDCIYSFS